LYESDLLAEVEKLIEELRLRNSVSPIVVEGRNDVRALRNLGLQGEIISFNQGRSIVNFTEMVSKGTDSVILLPDWDRKGRQLLNEWRRQFRSLDVKVFDELWAGFIHSLKKEITCVEELDSLIFRLRRDTEEGAGARLEKERKRKEHSPVK